MMPVIYIRDVSEEEIREFRSVAAKGGRRLAEFALDALRENVLGVVNEKGSTQVHRGKAGKALGKAEPDHNQPKPLVTDAMGIAAQGGVGKVTVATDKLCSHGLLYHLECTDK